VSVPRLRSGSRFVSPRVHDEPIAKLCPISVSLLRITFPQGGSGSARASARRCAMRRSIGVTMMGACPSYPILALTPTRPPTFASHLSWPNRRAFYPDGEDQLRHCQFEILSCGRNGLGASPPPQSLHVLRHRYRTGLESCGSGFLCRALRSQSTGILGTLARETDRPSLSSAINCHRNRFWWSHGSRAPTEWQSRPAC